MSVYGFKTPCALDNADEVSVKRIQGYFAVEVREDGSRSECCLSFEDALALAEYIVTELEEEEV